MGGSQLSPTYAHIWATLASTDEPVAEEQLLVLVIPPHLSPHHFSLDAVYYLQIKCIRVHETLVSISAGMFLGFIIRRTPGNMIRDDIMMIMLVRELPPRPTDPRHSSIHLSLILNSGY